MPPSPRAMDGTQQRRLLDTAHAEFAEHGFEHASLNRILERADISKGAFYYHYANKHALFHSVVVDSFGPLLAAAGRPPPADDAPSFWAHIEHWVDDLYAQLRDHPEHEALLRAAASVMADPRWAQAHEEIHKRIEAPIIATIQDGQRVGAVRTDIPAPLLAELVFAVDERLDRYMLLRDPANGPDLDEWRRIGFDLMRRVAEPAGGVHS